MQEFWIDGIQREKNWIIERISSSRFIYLLKIKYGIQHQHPICKNDKNKQKQNKKLN